MTRFHVDGEWVELDELIEKYKKYNALLEIVPYPESAVKQWYKVMEELKRRRETIIELSEELEAIINKVKEWNLTHHRDKHAASSILIDLERMLGLEDGK